MAWTRTRLEVPEITGDPSVQLATPPPDSRWTPRLGRTVTDGQVSRVSTLSPMPSSVVANCPCGGSEIFVYIDPGGSGIGVSGQSAARPPAPRPEREGRKLTQRVLWEAGDCDNFVKRESAGVA